MSSTSSKSSGSSNLRLGTRWLVGAGVLLTSLLASPQVVSAACVSDAQRKVDRTLQELDDLRDAMGQLDEDYAGAQDRQEELEQDIAESQVRIDDLNGQLGGVQNVLTDIAVDRFTSGGSLLSSPTSPPPAPTASPSRPRRWASRPSTPAKPTWTRCRRCSTS